MEPDPEIRRYDSCEAITVLLGTATIISYGTVQASALQTQALTSIRMLELSWPSDEKAGGLKPHFKLRRGQQTIPRISGYLW